MKKLCIAAVTALALASTANAASFTYNATFDNSSQPNSVITGSFDGDLNGNVITNLSNITAIFSGKAFNGSGALYGSHFNPNQGFISGGAVASLDGTQNNFLFIDSDYPTDGNYSNYYYSLTDASAGGYGDFVGATNGYGSNSNNITHFTATQVNLTSDVPEPASWAMMVGGFGLLGAVMRRRRTIVAMA